MIKNKIFDVIVIGGSYSGLSAAMTLGRFCRETLIIDNNLPCNRFSTLTHNFFTQDGRERIDVTLIAKDQALNYPNVSLVSDFAVTGEITDDGFLIETKKGDTFTSKKLIFATGIKDEIPDIIGFKECWGISVIHCPYCHGYELRNLKTAILCNGKTAFSMATLMINLTSELIILTEGLADFTEIQLRKLKNHNIQVIETSIKEILHDHGTLRKIVLNDNQEIDTEVLYTSLLFLQNTKIPQQLGCSLNDHGLISIDHEQQTTIPGIYACGDNSAVMRSVSKAVFAGNLAGAMVNKNLSDDNF